MCLPSILHSPITDSVVQVNGPNPVGDVHFPESLVRTLNAHDTSHPLNFGAAVPGKIPSPCSILDILD